MIWRTAWKNVWRNRIRSLVIISSVAIGIFAGIFTVAMTNGMISQRVHSALNEEISHIQVSHKDFRINYDPVYTIDSSENVISEIKSVEGVTGVAQRTIINGMASTATKSAGVQIVGVDPVKEEEVFTLYQKIKPGTGNYFEKKSKFNLAVVGVDLAKELNIIKFSIDSGVISRLKLKNIPLPIINRLQSFIGKKFNSEKKFTKELESLLSGKIPYRYILAIKSEAWSFRQDSKLTLTFLDRENNQVDAAFRIAGLYDTDNSVFEETMIFVKDADLKKLVELPAGSCHQIFVRVNDFKQSNRIAKLIKSKLKNPEVLSWEEIQPELALTTELAVLFYAAFMIIILAALAFGIVNTMLMVVLERTKELGMLTAIGMNKRKVFSMIMFESVFLSLTGGIVGMIISKIIIAITGTGGINFSQYAEGFEAYGYSAQIFPEINLNFFAMVTILIILTGILSSVYPALKALKLDPAEAIRTE